MLDPDADGGRRLYVHRDSLRLAGDHNPAAAAEIASAMWSMRIVKLLNHRVFDDAEAMGLEPPEAVVRAMDTLTRVFWPRVTELLHRSQVVDARNKVWGRPALKATEAVMGSCFFDGYYTFATGATASAEMLADTRAMREVHAGIDDPGRTPLTVVRGNRLRCPGETFLHASHADAQADISAALKALIGLPEAAGLDEDWTHMVQSAGEAAKRLLEAKPY